MKDEAKKVSDCHEYKDVRSRSRKYAKLFPDDPSGSDIFVSQIESSKCKHTVRPMSYSQSILRPEIQPRMLFN